MAVFKYFHGEREVSEKEWRKHRTRRMLKIKSGEIDRNRDCKTTMPAAPPLRDVMDAHDERYRRWYGEPPPPVIEDYRSEEAKKTWPGYQRVWTPQGWKEGPRRFQSREEERSYQRAYGFFEYSGSEHRR